MKNSRRAFKNCFRNKKLLGLVSIVCLLFSLSARGAGSIFTDDFASGEPARWPFDANLKKWVVHWKADKGRLAPGISNQAAIDQWVKPLLEKWKTAGLAVAGAAQPQTTVALEFVYDGQAGVDITVDNYGPYLSADINQPLPTVVIFDEDGSIIQDYFGGAIGCGEPKNCIAGIAAPVKRDASTKTILRGFVILNGRLLDGVNTAENREMNPDQFKGVILHELGHLLNLDHTQVNAEMAESCPAFDCAGGETIPTMYPASLSREQLLLHRDDIIAASFIYPNETFTQNFCTIQGEVLNTNGEPMAGVNVIARNGKDPIGDARSMVTGALYPGSAKDGHYFLYGIVPGEDYEVVFEELLQKYNAGGGFAPLGADSPTGFGAGHIPGPDGAASVRCNRGGEVLQIPSFKMVSQDPAGNPEPPLPLPAAPVEKKGWCQLNPSASIFSRGEWLLIPLAFCLFFLRRRCYKS